MIRPTFATLTAAVLLAGPAIAQTAPLAPSKPAPAMMMMHSTATPRHPDDGRHHQYRGDHHHPGEDGAQGLADHVAWPVAQQPAGGCHGV